MTVDARTKERLAHLAAMRSAMCGCELCERAAVYEFDAGLGRGASERLAAGEVLPGEVAELEREVSALRHQGGRR